MYVDLHKFALRKSWAKRQTHAVARKLRHREALLTQLDSRRQDRRQVDLSASEPLDRIDPASRRSGHGHGMRAGHGDAVLRVLAAEIRAHLVDGAVGRGAARAVHGLDRLGLGVVVQDEHVAADACAAGFGHVHAGGHGHGSVLSFVITSQHAPWPKGKEMCKISTEKTYSCVATSSQHLKTALGCQGLRAGNHALGAVDDAAARGEAAKLGRGLVHKDGRRGLRHLVFVLLLGPLSLILVLYNASADAKETQKERERVCGE